MRILNRFKKLYEDSECNNIIKVSKQYGKMENKIIDEKWNNDKLENIPDEYKEEVEKLCSSEGFNRIYGNYKLKTVRQKIPVIYKVSAAVAVLLLVFNISIATVPAIKNITLNFLAEDGLVATHIGLSEKEQAQRNKESSGEDTKLGPEVEYRPTYIPKEYKVSQEIKTMESLSIEFYDEQDNLLQYDQSPDTSSLSIDSENAKSYNIKVGEDDALLIIKNQKSHLVVHKDKYFITVSGEKISKDEIIKIAESIKEVK
jgi:hypothetical protein